MVVVNLLVAKDKLEQVQHLIDCEDRLNELVLINQSSESDIVVDDRILVLPSWTNIRPPILIPSIPFNPNALLGIIYAQFNNYKKAYSLLESNPIILKHVDIIRRLQHGIDIDLSSRLIKNDFISLHNLAVTYHYYYLNEPSPKKIEETYQQAITHAPDNTYKAYSVWHYSYWLNDMGYVDRAEEVLQDALKWNLPICSSIALKNALCSVWLKKLISSLYPFDTKFTGNIKKYLNECWAYYKSKNNIVEVGLMLNGLAEVNMYTHDYKKALEYADKAMEIFKDEEIPELTGQAQLNKGKLYQIWAENGMPQLYSSSIQEYQKVLSIFTKDKAPDIFANVHHQLGVIFSEVPDKVKKKSIWAATSVSSFNEALKYFNKTDFPYEYAGICHSFGNAYIKYPQSVHVDNFEKALGWYKEALDIRTAEKYPKERLSTLNNYLEVNWYATNKTDFNQQRYQDMMRAANEILNLSEDENIISSVKKDIKRLQTLKQSSISVRNA